MLLQDFTKETSCKPSLSLSLLLINLRYIMINAIERFRTGIRLNDLFKCQVQTRRLYYIVQLTRDFYPGRLRVLKDVLCEKPVSIKVYWCSYQTWQSISQQPDLRVSIWMELYVLQPLFTRSVQLRQEIHAQRDLRILNAVEIRLQLRVIQFILNAA